MFARKLILVVACLAVSALAVGVGHAVAMPQAQELSPSKLVEPDSSTPIFVYGVTKTTPSRDGFLRPPSTMAIMSEGLEAATPTPVRVFLPVLAKQPTATPTPTVTPPPISPEPGRIIFSARTNPQCPLYEYIYVMNSDGSNVRNLLSFSGAAVDPSWSPDGNKIAFTRYFGSGTCSLYVDDGSIAVMNSDGSGITQLGSGHGPDWSPDSQKIVFSSDDDIYVMKSDGSNRTRLTTDPETDRNPTWSPDGERIAFSSRREGHYHIYVMNADGSGVARLTAHSVGHADAPAWSPNGATIAYHYNPSVPWGDSASEIYVMNADGSGARNITNFQGMDDAPAWSPNGTQIVFSSDRDGDRDIYVMNASGTAQTRLTNNVVHDFGPDWHR